MNGFDAVAKKHPAVAAIIPLCDIADNTIPVDSGVLWNAVWSEIGFVSPTG